MLTRRTPPLVCALCALCALCAPLLRAQDRPYPLVIGLPATARYAGLANAGVAVHGDAGALFINPAAL